MSASRTVIVNRRRLGLIGAAAALGLIGCGDDFLDESVLAGLRVLAVEASPLEAGPDDTLKLRATVHVPEGDTLQSERWTFCPLTAGSTGGYRCAVPECESELAVTGDGTVTVKPHELALACVARLGELAGAAAGPASGEPPEQLQTLIMATHRSRSGDERQTALTVPLHLAGPPATRNRPPSISEVLLDGRPLSQASPAAPSPAGAELELGARIAPGSLDSYTDVAGRARIEEPIVSFFTSAGRLSASREVGTEVRVTLKLTELDASTSRALVYVVARDGRGGQHAVGPLTVPISR